MNGTDMNGDGRKDWALCQNVVPYCQSDWLLLQLLAPMVNVNGSRPGLLWDPDTLEPQVGAASQVAGWLVGWLRGYVAGWLQSRLLG